MKHEFHGRKCSHEAILYRLMLTHYFAQVQKQAELALRMDYGSISVFIQLFESIFINRIHNCTTNNHENSK